MEKTLPNNWVETELTNLVSFIIGGDWGSEPDSDLDDSTLTLCIRGGELKEWRKNKGNTAVLRRIKNSSLEKRKLELGDILLEISGGGPDQPVGRTVYIDKDVLNFNVDIPKICTNFFRQIKLHTIIDSKYVNSYLQYFYIAGDITNYQGGSNNLRNLKYKDYETLQIPLPPLPEQERIANKLDALFAQLDGIRTAMERIPILLKNFRQQVLTQAVTGKLTEEWREGKELEDVNVKEYQNQNYLIHDIPEYWIHSIIENIGKVKGGKRLPKGEELVNYNTGLPYIRARDLKEGTVLTENLMYLEAETQFRIKNYIVKTNDVYITIVGAKIGDAGIIPKNMNNANLTENAAKITDFHKELNPFYLALWLRSPISQKNIQETIMSAAQGKLALTRIDKLPIYLPPLLEQQKIVRRVESLFKQADTIEQQYISLKQKIDNLPQAILHKAFKGELVEQLPTDGDAHDLLRQIEELKESTKKKK